MKICSFFLISLISFDLLSTKVIKKTKIQKTSDRRPPLTSPLDYSEGRFGSSKWLGSISTWCDATAAGRNGLLFASVTCVCLSKLNRKYVT